MGGRPAVPGGAGRVGDTLEGVSGLSERGAGMAQETGSGHAVCAVGAGPTLQSTLGPGWEAEGGLKKVPPLGRHAVRESLGRFAGGWGVADCKCREWVWPKE